MALRQDEAVVRQALRVGDVVAEMVGPEHGGQVGRRERGRRMARPRGRRAPDRVHAELRGKLVPPVDRAHRASFGSAGRSSAADLSGDRSSRSLRFPCAAASTRGRARRPCYPSRHGRLQGGPRRAPVPQGAEHGEAPQGSRRTAQAPARRRLARGGAPARDRPHLGPVRAHGPDAPPLADAPAGEGPGAVRAPSPHGRTRRWPRRPPRPSLIGLRPLPSRPRSRRSFGEVLARPEERRVSLAHRVGSSGSGWRKQPHRPTGRRGDRSRTMNENTDQGAERPRHEAGPRPRGRPAVRVSVAPRVRRTRLEAPARVPRRHEGAVGVGPVAAGPHDQEPRRAQASARRPPDRRPVRGHRARPAGARDDVDAAPAPDGQHDGRDGPVRGPGPSLHGPRALGSGRGVPVPPDGRARLAARGRHVGGRGAHAPLPDQGARRADPDLPAVLRALHADGSGRQRHVPDPEVQVRDETERALGRDARVPPPDAQRPRRRRLGRGHGQRPDQTPAGVAVPPVRHRERSRRAHRDQGSDGHPPALPAGRRAGRVRRHREAGARARGRGRRSTPT